MFGYIKVEHSELKVKEYELYRSTYCGLCRAMGKCTGQCSRMTLNYDFVFLALARLALTPAQVTFKRRRCLAHPFTKRNSMEKNPILTYCAGASAILNYQKIADDIADEKGFKRFRARLVLPFVSHARKKAIRRAPELRALDEAVAKRLCELTELEKSNAASVDRPAYLFGALLGDIMAFGLEGNDARVAYELGKSVGAWIYIADAIDDMKDDVQKKRYNPIVMLYGGRLPTKEELDSISAAIRNHLFSAEAAFDLFGTEDEAIKNIIYNILYLGIPNKTDKIIENQADKEGKESSND